MKRCFTSADILLPKTDDYQKWSVIACDQHTSDVEYWDQVKELVGASFSTLHMILPEADLEKATADSVHNINAYMRKRIEEGCFSSYPGAYIYVERTLVNGDIRQGIVGLVDLEDYHFIYEPGAMLCATEKTVMERIPPRVAIRKDATLEFPHIIVFCDDSECSIIEPVSLRKDSLIKLYDFDLMLGGGHISGWLLNGEAALALDQAIAEYEQKDCYLVADGNHSLATAKQCYENEKEQGIQNPAGRYALVELENVNSPAINFEAIHRVLTNADTRKLLKDMSDQADENGNEICWMCGGEEGVLRLRSEKDEMTVATLQRFLDQWLMDNTGVLDYIHDVDVLKNLSKEEGSIAFYLPKPVGSEMFSYIRTGNVLPRKTFSLGHSSEKRYYLEGRMIK